MSTPFIGEIKLCSFAFAPKGWAVCNGQLLSIAQNQALFALLGTTYGGDGRTNFALPNLQGRVPLSFGNGLVLGEVGGEQTHTLTNGETPTHTHIGMGSTVAADQGSPAGALWAQASSSAYSPNQNTSMNPQSVGSAGGGQPHDNMSPYLTLNFCIALQGMFPSRS